MQCLLTNHPFTFYHLTFCPEPSSAPAGEIIAASVLTWWRSALWGVCWGSTAACPVLNGWPPGWRWVWASPVAWDWTAGTWSWWLSLAYVLLASRAVISHRHIWKDWQCKSNDILTIWSSATINNYASEKGFNCLIYFWIQRGNVKYILETCVYKEESNCFILDRSWFLIFHSK